MPPHPIPLSLIPLPLPPNPSQHTPSYFHALFFDLLLLSRGVCMNMGCGYLLEKGRDNLMVTMPLRNMTPLPPAPLTTYS